MKNDLPASHSTVNYYPIGDVKGARNPPVRDAIIEHHDSAEHTLQHIDGIQDPDENDQARNVQHNGQHDARLRELSRLCDDLAW